MGFVTVGTENSTDVELYYEDHGRGRPVVLVHGWALSGRSWEHQVPALVGAGYRVITYDRRGFGGSSQPWEGYDYDTLAADLRVLLEKLDLEDVTLVGFSMGGGEVARYVGAYGAGRVRQAVFASAVTPYLFRSGDNPGGVLDDAAIETVQKGLSADRIAFFEEFTRTCFSAGRESLVSEDQRLFVKQIAALASPKGTLDCVEAFGRTDFRPDLARIDVPTLVIHGGSDQVVPFEVSGRRTAESVPGATAHVVEGGPHCVNATHPAEFNEALLGFLRSGNPAQD